MGSKSGAHVQIDGVEYQLASDLDTIFRRHYEHSFESLFVQGSQTVSGKPGAQNLRPDILLQKWDDWSGGEGNRFYDEKEPLTYDSGNVNPREPGYLSCPPTRTDVAMPAAAAASSKCYLSVTDNGVWLTTDKKTYYSTAPQTSWTDTTNGFEASHSVSSATTADHNYLYVATWDGTKHSIRQIKSDAHRTFETSVAGSKHLAMAWIRGQLFVLNQDGTVYYYDTTSAPPTVGTKLGSLTDDWKSPTLKMFPTDTGAVIMASKKGITHLYEIIAGANPVMRTMTTFVEGFSGADVCFAQGIAFVLGDYETRTALWMFPLSQRQPIFVDYIRKGTTYTEVVCRPGPGSQVLMGMQTGEVFVYDYGLNAVSQLDVAPTSSGTYLLDDVVTFNARRVAALRKTSSTFVPKSSSWEHDDVPSTGVDGVWVSPAWHFGIPFDDKILKGFHLDFTPIPVSGAQTIKVEYQLDESGTYTTLATITQATAGAQRGVVDLTASTSGSTVKARNLRFRVTLHAGAQLLDFDPECHLASYNETWDLAIRVQDETPTLTGQSSVRGRSWHSNKLRQSMIASMRSRKVVSFVDAYESPDYTENYTYDVLIENVRDVIMESNTSDGIMFLTLRRVMQDQA